MKNYGMWSCRNHGSRNPESGKVLVHNPNQYGWDFFVKRIEFFLTRILNAKECVFILCNLKKIFALKDILKVQTNFQNKEE